MILAQAEHQIVTLTQQAGQLAMRYFRHGQTTHAEIHYKKGTSPVSAADMAVDAFLRAHLPPLIEGAAWLSEESEDSPQRLSAPCLFIVDPIDGTRGFISGDPRWMICVALADHAGILFSVLVAPALDETFVAARGRGAMLNGKPLRAQDHPAVLPPRVAGPTPMMQRLEHSGTAIQRLAKIPSLAYRLVSVASGQLDLALAGANAHDWDIAAADLVLRESGLLLTTLEGAPPSYNRRDSRHSALVAATDPLHKTALIALASADVAAQ